MAVSSEASRHLSTSSRAVRSLRRSFGDGVCCDILGQKPPNRALDQKPRTSKIKKVSFRSDDSRCEIGIDHPKLEPADRQQGPHVYRLCSSVNDIRNQFALAWKFHWYKGGKQGKEGRRGRSERHWKGAPFASSRLFSLLVGREREADEEMGEMVMAGYGLDKTVRASISFDTPCGALLHELEVNEKHTSLKDQLAAVTPLLEDLRAKKEERIKQISNVLSQIEKIKAQISDHSYQNNDGSVKHLNDDNDLSTRRLSDLQMQLRNLQKEKSDRLQKVFIYVDEVHCLCAVLGMDFAKTVKEVHPSLHGTNSEHSTNISDSTLEGLTQAILKLKAEKKTRVLKTEEEVEMLTKQKASRMKELVLKKRMELEDICRHAHMEPDMSTAPEKIVALIDSGLVDPCELLSSIEVQITKANEESLTRKDIMERVDKWLSACDEETWLEEYNQDNNRYSAGRGAHLNLKRAEKARVLVQKIPTMIDNLIAKTFAWEDERNVPFLYDGDQKKLQSLLLKEKELIFGSKPSPKKTSSFNRRNSSHHPNGNGAGFMTPVPRRVSAGSATPELLTPRSYSGRYNNYFKENRRLTPAPLNFSTASKDDSMSSFASISGSEPDSPLYLH
ncbi:hypothetical protein PR202_gb19160 [Eleusine coracana subsp. coracana]|uniref:Uncharacterized protein n=1 Tax=Eleusine coracana subsp. coracana TaxID=191504 RepID=A0AAV5F593_ELECO|nr:hypothetical protein PR202_gb19160 [Eleusine coracana subsp. coracana]